MELTQEQYDRLWTAYESALSVDGYESARVGEHAILVQTMLEMGFSVSGVVDAYKVCRRVFGW